MPAALGLDLILNSLNLWVFALRPPKEGRADLASILLHEERPDLGELKTVSDEVFASIAGDVQDILVPHANYSRMESLWLWFGWTQSNQLLAKTSSISPVAAVQADSRPVLVHPPMTVSTGEFDIVFTGEQGRDLQFARFVPGQDGATPKGSILWKIPLAAKPVVTRAALGPVRAKSPRRVLLGFQEKEGVALHLYDLADGKQPGPPVIAHIPNEFLLPNQQPALRVDDDGNTQAAVLLANPATPTNLSLADIVFPASPQNPPQVKPGAAKKLSAKPLAAALTYTILPNYPQRRDWAVLMINGKIVNSLADNEPMKPFGIPVVPLQLAAMSRATYFLTQLPDRVTLEPLT
ncbi:MAG TPA: hypothetical protein VHQ47_04460 [Phycisphaerae bacterium]|nr:hypothetical protein [Phycisphaerae bacterium]